MAGVDRTPVYLDDVSNWIWYHEAVALFEAAAELTGDPRIGRGVGEEMVRQHAGTPVATLMRSLGPPEAIYEQLRHCGGEVQHRQRGERTRRAPPGRALCCRRRLDRASRATSTCATGPAACCPSRPSSSGCLRRGSRRLGASSGATTTACTTVTWDAEEAAKTADPYELVTALEAQLPRCRGRLDSMYATARDLIASDDLDAALARITDRAATAVRAPKYLLAVRIGAEGRLHVHHRGYLDEEAGDAADALLADTGERQRRVASRRRGRVGEPSLRPAHGRLARRGLLPPRARPARRLRPLCRGRSGHRDRARRCSPSP